MTSKEMTQAQMEETMRRFEQDCARQGWVGFGLIVKVEADEHAVFIGHPDEEDCNPRYLGHAVGVLCEACRDSFSKEGYTEFVDGTFEVWAEQEDKKNVDG